MKKKKLFVNSSYPGSNHILNFNKKLTGFELQKKYTKMNSRLILAIVIVLLFLIYSLITTRFELLKPIILSSIPIIILLFLNRINIKIENKKKKDDEIE